MKRIAIISLALIGLLRADPVKRTIESDYKYDEKSDSMEYYEYYISGDKKVKHGISLKIFNVGSKLAGGVTIQKDVYQDGEVVSASTKAIIDKSARTETRSENSESRRKE